MPTLLLCYTIYVCYMYHVMLMLLPQELTEDKCAYLFYHTSVCTSADFLITGVTCDIRHTLIPTQKKTYLTYRIAPRPNGRTTYYPMSAQRPWALRMAPTATEKKDEKKEVLFSFFFPSTDTTPPSSHPR
jgi:hypothetical protein